MKMITAACAVGAALLVGCGDDDSSGSTSPPPAGVISAGKALDVAQSVGAVPESIGSSEGPLAPSDPGAQLRREGRWFVMPGRKTSARIARDPSEGMQFQLYAQHRIIGNATATPIGLGGSASSATPIADSQGLFFANAYPSTDAVVLPGPAGPIVTLQLRSPQAPSEFSWRVVGSPGRLVGDPRSQSAGLNYRFHTPQVSGSIDLLYLQVGQFAYDSSGLPARSTDPSNLGRKLPTHLSVSGDQVTIRIDRPPGSLVYPLVVDIDWNNDPIP